MGRYILLLFLLMLFVDSQAQKEDYVWFLGKDQSTDPGIQGMMWDWNKNTPIPIQHNLAYGIDNNNASICDKDGNLLFWSNGCAVINRNQEVMPHGDTLNWDAYREVIGWKECVRGYPGTQNLKILPNPVQKDGYYILHKAFRYNGQFEDITLDFRFSYVDMALDEGAGDVVFFDSILVEESLVPHCLEIISSDKDDMWWILNPLENTDSMMVYLIDETGIHRSENQYSYVTFEDLRAGAGTMRFSPDGTKLAYYDYFLNLHVYHFDRARGEISNHQKVTIFDDAEDKPNNEFRFGSVEWSPNSRFMYVAVSDSLFQIDCWKEDMNDGIRLIDVWNGTLDPFPTTFYIASLAPDCKIYICSMSGSRSYHIIHKPNELGTDCNFVQNGLKLPQSAGSANLPLYPRFRVDEEEKCDSTITSIFGETVFYRRDLKVYPSPSTGPITIKLPEDVHKGQLMVINLDGQIVKKLNINSSQSSLQVDLSYEKAGHYHIELYPKDRIDRVFYGTQIILTR